MNEQEVTHKQTFLQVDISLVIYAPQTISVFAILNTPNTAWKDP